MQVEIQLRQCGTQDRCVPPNTNAKIRRSRDTRLPPPHDVRSRQVHRVRMRCMHCNPGSSRPKASCCSPASTFSCRLNCCCSPSCKACASSSSCRLGCCCSPSCKAHLPPPHEVRSRQMLCVRMRCMHSSPSCKACPSSEASRLPPPHQVRSRQMHGVRMRCMHCNPGSSRRQASLAGQRALCLSPNPQSQTYNHHHIPKP